MDGAGGRPDSEGAAGDAILQAGDTGLSSLPAANAEIAGGVRLLSDRKFFDFVTGSA